MNSSAFYEGVMTELTKLADEVPLQPQPKKHNWGSIATGAGIGLGVGAAGLAANSLYGMLNKSTQGYSSISKPPIPEELSNPSIIDDAAAASNGGLRAGETALGSYGLASWLKNKITGKGLPGASLLEKIPKGVSNAAWGGADALYGASNINEAFKNTDNNNGIVRAAEGAGGTAQTALGLGALLGKGLPPATSGVGKALLGTRGFGALGGIPALAASAVPITLGLGGDAAQGHSDRLSSSIDELAYLNKLMSSHDPSTHKMARSAVNNWFKLKNTPNRINDVTNPSTLARIGYNPVPKQWYNPMAYFSMRNDQDPNLQSFNHILEQTRHRALWGN